MIIELDASVYSLEAVQKAAYRFINRLTILLSQDGAKIICEIEQISGKMSLFEDVLADFKRELLDQQLRVRIKLETEATRNLILALAFSESDIVS